MLGALLVLAITATWLVAVFDALTADPTRCRLLEKGWWVLITLVFFIIGAAAWFAFGRPRAGVAGYVGFQRPEGADGRPSGSPGFGLGTQRPRRNPPKRPIAPDDDPDFLRSL